ncbi:MAG: LPXTG cell wall anchor domain-containing protein [Enterococcus casseliflavus]
MKVLPHTGEAATGSLSALGLGLISLVGMVWKKRVIKQ